jgi:hypothetical protein
MLLLKLKENKETVNTPKVCIPNLCLARKESQTAKMVPLCLINQMIKAHNK